MTKRFLLLWCLVVLSCTKMGSSPSALTPSTPDGVVKRFVELSASAQTLTDKKKLEELCLGEMRRTFERMTDEVFTLAYLSGSLKIVELAVLENAVGKESARIRYRVAVENRQGTDPTREVNEREVELAFSQGAWYIETIRLKGSDQLAFTSGMLF